MINLSLQLTAFRFAPASRFAGTPAERPQLEAIRPRGSCQPAERQQIPSFLPIEFSRPHLWRVGRGRARQYSRILELDNSPCHVYTGSCG